MSTQDSTTHDVSAEIHAACATAKATLEERHRTEIESLRAAEVEAKAERLKEWAGTMAAIRLVLPAWAHPYIEEPHARLEEYSDFHESYCYNHVRVELPGCNPIAVWANHSGQVCFEAMKSHIISDEETDVAYVQDTLDSYRRSSWEMNYGEKDWSVVVATAHDAYLHRLSLLDRVVELNIHPDPVPVPVPESKPATVEMPFDPTSKVLAAIQELDFDLDTVYERGVLYAFIMLAGELRYIREAAEDIAAVMLANDPKRENE